jgi:hypothetical protein
MLQTWVKLRNQRHFYVMHCALGMTVLTIVLEDSHMAVCNVWSRNSLFLHEACTTKKKRYTRRIKTKTSLVQWHISLALILFKVFIISQNTMWLRLFTHNSVLCVILFLSHPRWCHWTSVSFSPIFFSPYSLFCIHLRHRDICCATYRPSDWFSLLQTTFDSLLYKLNNKHILIQGIHKRMVRF